MPSNYTSPTLMLGEREGAGEAALVVAVLRQAIADAQSLSIYNTDRVEAIRFLRNKEAVITWLHLIGVDECIYPQILQIARVEP